MNCIVSVLIVGDFREKFVAISRAGFMGIEIFEQGFVACDGAAVDVGWLVKDYGLEIMLFQSFQDFEGLPESYWLRAFDSAERKFDLMNSMGADLSFICSDLSTHSLGGIDRAADDLAALGEGAKAGGIRIGLDALAVSPNYYEDLGARFGLEDAFVARLRDARILYDEDMNGRYF